MGYYNNYETKPTSKNKPSFYIWGIIIGLSSSLLTFLLLYVFQDDFKSKPTTSSATVVETSITKAVESSSKTVVEILNITSSNLTEPFQSGSGSGIVYKKDKQKAYIVTNHHVVENASKLKVTLPDGSELNGELLGSDSLADLAVITVDADKIKDVAKLGDSSKLKLGEPAIAIGNPLGHFPGSVTSGIISSTKRTIENDFNQDGFSDWSTDVIQTDAAINPGNSGGALINAAGEVIGINSSKIAQEAVEGIGFAIPINTAIPILKQIEENGEVKRPYLGISMLDLQLVPEKQRDLVLNAPKNLKNGVVVVMIDPKSPAAKGLKENDIIIRMGDVDITGELDLRKILYQYRLNDTIDITVLRNGEEKKITIKLFEVKHSK